MYEALRTKVEKAAEAYIDLLTVRIQEAGKASPKTQGKTAEAIDTAIRSLGYITAMLEKVDRLCCNKDGQ